MITTRELRFTAAELARLRADNERLRSDLTDAKIAWSDQGILIKDLQKHIRELDAALDGARLIIKRAREMTDEAGVILILDGFL
jgi:predicted  nucleic acid-binding Zn-ribbon protein